MEHYVGRNIPANWWELTTTNIISYDDEFDQDPKPSVAAAFIDFAAFDLLTPRQTPKHIVDWEPNNWEPNDFADFITVEPNSNNEK